MLDLRSIQVFLVVSDTASFTTAARRLNRTQSAISQAIRQLEEELGMVLINRGSRFLSLTPAGQILQSRARQLLEQATALASELRETAHAKVQELRVGMVDSFAVAVGPTLIKSMLIESANLSLWSDLTPKLGQALLEGSVDVIVANQGFEGQEGLRCFELLREPYVLLVPKGQAWDDHALDLEKLARTYPFVRYQDWSYLASQIDSQLRHLNISPSRRVAVDSTDKLLAMVAAGVGWSSSTPLSLLRAKSHIDAIRILPFPGERFYRRLYMLSRRGEFDELTKRLAATAREVLHGPIMDELVHLFPALREQISVPDETDLQSDGPEPAERA